MKIHSIRQQLGERRIAGVAGVLAICGAAILGVTNCSIATAQGLSSHSKAAVAGAERGQPIGRQLSHGNQAFRVISAADVQTAADNQGEQSTAQGVQQVGWTSPCPSCGTGCGGTCGGSYGNCGSCGQNCRGTCGSGYAPFSGFGNPCAPANPSATLPSTRCTWNAMAKTPLR